jgi:hypothetical protein
MQISCFDLSDKAQCGNFGSPEGLPTCERYVYPYGTFSCSFFPFADSFKADFSDTGITSNNNYTNGLITDVNLHGFATNGWTGPVGNNVKIIRFKANGNGTFFSISRFSPFFWTISSMFLLYAKWLNLLTFNKAGGGMNFDNGDETTGTGTFTMSYFELIGNGRFMLLILLMFWFLFIRWLFLYLIFR